MYRCGAGHGEIALYRVYRRGAGAVGISAEYLCLGAAQGLGDIGVSVREGTHMEPKRD